MVRNLMAAASVLAVMASTVQTAAAQESPEREGLEFVAKIGKFILGTTTLPVHERPAATKWIDLLAERVRESDGHCLVVKAYGTADVNRYPSHHPTQNHVLAQRRCHEAANNFGSRPGVDKSSFICMAPVAPTPDSERYVFLYLDHSRCEAQRAQRDRDAGQDGAIVGQRRRLDGHDGALRALDGRVRLLEEGFGRLDVRWNGVDVGVGGQMVGEDPFGVASVGLRLELLNRVMGLHLGAALGGGGTPDLPQSKGGGSLLGILSLGLHFHLIPQLAFVLDGELGFHSAGEVGTKDEGLSGVSIGLRYQTGGADDFARFFIQAKGGYLHGWATGFENRHLGAGQLLVGANF